jgi:hypothetical protein
MKLAFCSWAFAQGKDGSKTVCRKCEKMHLEECIQQSRYADTAHLLLLAANLKDVSTGCKRIMIRNSRVERRDSC